MLGAGLFVLFACTTAHGIARLVSIRTSGSGAVAIRTLLAEGVLLAFGAEALSVAHAFNRSGILTLWVLLAAALTAAARRWGVDLPSSPWRRPTAVAVGLGVGAAAIGLVGLVLAVKVPPNNYDSFTYHLARVLGWLQHGSIWPYPSSSLWQTANPPGAEVAVAHVRALAGTDRLVNTVQWVAAMLAALVAARIARQLGGRSLAPVIAAVMTLSTPIVIAEMATTQNDLVVALWCLCFISIALEEEFGPRTAVFLGAAAGLALTAKVTAIFVLIPFGIWASWRMVATRRSGAWRPALVAGAVALAINSGWMLRNVALTGSPLGGGEAGIAATHFGPRRTLVIGALNASQEMASPFAGLNSWIDARLHGFAQLLGLQLTNPTIGVNGSPHLFWGKNEDFQPDPYVLVLIGLVALLFLVPRFGFRTSQRLSYAAALVTGYGLFSTVLLYQVFNTRLSLPLLVAWAPLIAVALERLRIVGTVLAFGTLCLGLAVAVTNDRRPLINPGFDWTRPVSGLTHLDSGSVLTKSRQSLEFTSLGPAAATDYAKAAALVRGSGARTVGLIAYMPYPMWHDLGSPESGVRVYDAWPSARTALNQPVQAFVCDNTGLGPVACDWLGPHQTAQFGQVRVLILGGPRTIAQVEGPVVVSRLTAICAGWVGSGCRTTAD